MYRIDRLANRSEGSLEPITSPMFKISLPSPGQDRARNILSQDIPKICSWVKTRKALRMVSGDNGDCLTPNILQKWLENSLENLVLIEIGSDQPIGFCTISISEIECLPAGCVELCHLIIDPKKRRAFSIGKRLCRAVKEKASTFGFSYIVGRVVPWNGYAKVLAEREGFTEIKDLPLWAPDAFHWYNYDLGIVSN
ncbi:MAG: GNAT family N-acetyltransferase [Candidatus Aminicenantes bacterium]|nr:GNAT family N-acetyltransferase [Candidatus Aminicenantes bacterium]